MINNRGMHILLIDVSEIDWTRLKDEYGIAAICFDKDNTLTAPYSQNLHLSVIESIEKCRQVFKGRIAVFSNSIGSFNYDPKFGKADLFTKTNGIQVIKHYSKVKLFCIFCTMIINIKFFQCRSPMASLIF